MADPSGVDEPPTPPAGYFESATGLSSNTHPVRVACESASRCPPRRRWSWRGSPCAAPYSRRYSSWLCPSSPCPTSRHYHHILPGHPPALSSSSRRFLSDHSPLCHPMLENNRFYLGFIYTYRLSCPCSYRLKMGSMQSHGALYT